MRRFLQRILLTICLLASTFQTTSGLADPDLSGEWRAPWVNDTNSYYRGFSRKFTDSKMIAITKTVMDHPAQGMYALDIEMHHTYTLAGIATGVTIPDGDVYNINLVSDKVLLTPQSVSAAGYFRNVQECGITDWAVGVPKDVSGRLCQQTGPEYPWFRRGEHRSYEILGITANFVRTGNILESPSENGTTQAARPRSFTPYVFHRN